MICGTSKAVSGPSDAAAISDRHPGPVRFNVQLGGT